MVAAVCGGLAVAGCHPAPTIESVSASKTNPVVGEQVTLTVTASRGGSTDSLLWMDWDFDGDGTYDDRRASFERSEITRTSSVFTSYAQPGVVRPGVVVFEQAEHLFFIGRMVQQQAEHRKLELNVVAPTPPSPPPPSPASQTPPAPPAGNQAPNASFVASPNPVEVTREVTFDGSGSSDPDGTVVRYEWDFDGDGTFDSDTGSTPTAKHAYQLDRTYEPVLRVTDNGGSTATFTGNVEVFAPPAGQAEAAVSQPGFAAGLPRFSVALRGGAAGEGVTRVNGDTVSRTGMLMRGRTRFLAPGPLPRGVARYALSHGFVAPLDGDSVEVHGVMLVRFRAGRTACFGVLAKGSPHGRIRTSMWVLGGSGALTRLRGIGVIPRLPDDGGKVTLHGRGRFDLGREPRGLPRRCRALNRELRPG